MCRFFLFFPTCFLFHYSHRIHRSSICQTKGHGGRVIMFGFLPPSSSSSSSSSLLLPPPLVLIHLVQLVSFLVVSQRRRPSLPSLKFLRCFFLNNIYLYISIYTYSERIARAFRLFLSSSLSVLLHFRQFTHSFT
jgi:hypothetical protein